MSGLLFLFTGANAKFLIFSFMLSGYFKSTSTNYPISLSSGVFKIPSNLTLLLKLISS